MIRIRRVCRAASSVGQTRRHLSVQAVWRDSAAVGCVGRSRWGRLQDRLMLDQLWDGLRVRHTLGVQDGATVSGTCHVVPAVGMGRALFDEPAEVRS